jgi:hypothetical protein
MKGAGVTTRPAVYPQGIDVTRKVAGVRWLAPAKGQSAWTGLSPGGFNAWCRWKGPSLSPQVALPELDRVVTWTPANQVVFFGPDRLMVKVHAGTGWITGLYRHSGAGVSQTFGGVLLQRQGLGTGSYVNERGSGRFWMQPRP